MNTTTAAVAVTGGGGGGGGGGGVMRVRTVLLRAILHRRRLRCGVNVQQKVCQLAKHMHGMETCHKGEGGRFVRLCHAGARNRNTARLLRQRKLARVEQMHNRLCNEVRAACVCEQLRHQRAAVERAQQLPGQRSPALVCMAGNGGEDEVKEAGYVATPACIDGAHELCGAALVSEEQQQQLTHRLEEHAPRR